jgi:ubiquitin C-terminal hydrolase
MESRNYAAAVKVIGVIIKDIAIMRDALMKIDITSPEPITKFFTKIQELVRALSELSKVCTDKGKTAIIKIMLTRAKGIEKMISSANDAAIEFFNATELSQNKKSSANLEYDNARMAFIDSHNTRIRDTSIADATKIRDDAMIVATTNYESAKTAATQKKAANDAAYGIATDKADKAYETAIGRATRTFEHGKDGRTPARKMLADAAYETAKAAAADDYTLAITAANDAAAKTTATADFNTEMAAATKAKATAIDDATTVYTNAKTTAEETYIKEFEKASAINANDDKLVKDKEFTTMIDDIKNHHKDAADKANTIYMYSNQENAEKNKNRADAIVKEDEAATKTLVKLAEAANVDYSMPVKLFGIGPMQTSMDDKLAKKLASVQTTFNDIFYFDDAGIQEYNAAKQNSERLKNAQVELTAAKKAKADIIKLKKQLDLDKTYYDDAVDKYKNVTDAFIKNHTDKNRTAFLAYEEALKSAKNEYDAAAAAAAKMPKKTIPAIETAHTIAKDSAFETFATAVKAKDRINEIKPELAAIADAKKIRDEKKAINEISERALEVPTMEEIKVQAKIDDLTKKIDDITKKININTMNTDELKTKYAFKLIETDFKKIRANIDTASAASATSKKSKFDDLEFLKGIIEDVRESVDEAENDENRDVKKIKTVKSDKKKKEVGNVVKTKLTSAEQGKQLAAEMRKRGVTIETNSSRGLQNQGNTCYMNAALQLIFSMTTVKDAIIDTKTGYSDTSTFFYLKQYMEKMNGGDDIQPANKLFDSVNKHFKGRSFGKQEDSHEMLIYLLDGVDENKTKTINNDLKCSDIETQVVTMDYTGDINKCREKNFSMNPKRHALYNEMNNERVLYCKISNNEEKKNIHSINIGDSKTPTTFKTIYDSYLSETDIIGTKTNIMDEILYPYFKSDNKSKPYTECAHIFEVVERTDDEKTLESPDKTYKFKYVKKQDKLKFYPEQKYLIIQLKRFKRFEGSNIKITTSINIEKSEIPVNDGTTDDVFRILGCICHFGKTLDGGHYTYVSFKNGIPEKFYNDSAVSAVDGTIRAKLKTECYVLLFERVTKVEAKAGGGSNQTNQTNAKNETRRCRLAAANLPPPNKYTRRHNKNKDRVVPTVTVIKR